MRDKTLSTTLSAGGRILLALLFVFSQTAWAVDASKSGAQAGAGSAAPAAKAQANATPSTGAQTSPSQNGEQKETAANGGRHEGIKVHGHWTIEVRNPDGTVVTHREFENSLTTSGAQLLVSLLTGAAVAGSFGIELDGSPEPCLESGYGGANVPGASPCFIYAPPGAGPAGTYTSIFATLAVSAQNSGASVLLTGSATAGEAGQVSLVSTVLVSCAASPGMTPAACSVGSVFTSNALVSFPFTQATITAVPVSAGQTIAVTVTFSFS